MTRKVFRVRVNLAGSQVSLRGESKSPRGTMYAIRGFEVDTSGATKVDRASLIRDAVEKVVTGLEAASS